ncbi:hypothetical protein OSB04_031607 [Centaurea solstitialis]|uniref:CCHC-type domain-containing protein n=1 Tax=Centaurea solstitialis TaxID=347529 RepID=A0AA38S9B0_9ASTR|nr:hypothetical protein OSB04_031607 [Centaurea solstitialis]
MSKATLICDHGGPYRGNGSSSRHTGTKKINCPFELVGKYSPLNGCWTLTVKCENHNHEPAEDMEGHPYAMRLTENEVRLVEDLSRKNVKPRDILSTLKEQIPDNVSTLKTIYNARRKFWATEHKGADKGALSSVEVESVVNEGARRQTRGNRKVQSERPPVEPEPSHQESSASQPAVFVTHEAFQTEMGKIQDALQTLLNQQERSKSDGGREDSGMSSPPATVVGGGSRQTPPASGELPKPTHGCSYKTFVACKPPVYKGERDPADALHWWNVETGGRGTEAVRTMTWKSFVAKFRSQFCLLAATKKMEEEFLQLKHGMLSVQEYTTRYIEKSRFAEVYVPTEERRVEREKDRQASKKIGEKRKWEGPAMDPRKGKFPRADSRGGQMQHVRPCAKCQKVHQGECRSGPPTCFRCGQQGHLSRVCTARRTCYLCGSPDHFKTDCPQLKRGGSSAPRDRALTVKDDGKAAPAPARSRAFRMTAEEAEEAPDVVTGTFLVNSIRAKVLFDTGSDYSYVTPELLKQCCVNLEPLDHPYEADTANGRVWVREFAKGCTIELEGCLVPVILRLIPMEGLDMVLGMD